MRVIEQTRLAFREGTSDKVYEVDLVEVATGQYVVNFRFGRRGSALRDGTKTPTPMPLAKARSIYEKLVAEKTSGGYQPFGSGAAATASGRGPSGPGVASGGGGGHGGGGRGGGDDDDGDHEDGDDEQDRAIVEQLRRGTRGGAPLGPVVWRAGDRDLRAAEPALLELIDARPPRGVEPAAWQHTVLAALARCGTTASLPRLTELAAGGRAAPHVRDVARLAIARIDGARAEALARPLLTPAVSAGLAHRDAAAVARAAEELLAADPGKARLAAVGLYLIDTAAAAAASATTASAASATTASITASTTASIARPAVLAFARVARLSNTEAAVVRTLYRLAEIRRDGELFALCARRIDDHDGARPFGVRTREYFRRRVARVLRRLGRAGSRDYVLMASAVLLSYSDEDGRAPFRGAYGAQWERFAQYHALNETLHGKRTRFERGHHGVSAWRVRDRRRGGAPRTPDPRDAHDARDERFPELWDRYPEALWTVLGAARATPVLEFAATALRANRAFVDGLPDAAVAAVLGGGHPIAQRAVYDLVRYRPMSTALARGALASSLDEAHVWVLLWIASHADQVRRDPELLALLLTGQTVAIRDAGEGLVRGRPPADDVARSAAARAIAILLGLPATATHAGEVAALLLRALAAPLRELAGDVLRDLIRHPLAALGELAGEAMLGHARRDELPHDLIELLLASPHASVRLLGGRLLATTPVDVAKDDLEALELFATSANRELREGTRGLLGELASQYPAVARALAARLVDGLLKPQPEGVPAHIVALLRGELASALPRISPETILKLIGALSPHAREAGGLLMTQLGPEDLGLDDLARLASHEIQAIREGAWSLARAAAPRYRLAPVALSRLVDSAWDDTREFAIGLLRGELADALDADAIVAICDSIRPEVQALGKALLQERFQTADAGRYLVRLAEHPSASLQLLVSGLLEHHLGADLERLRTIAPYLTTVLSQVNRGHVAKQRVLALLRREAARSPEAAALLLPILDRQSATIAITQKHPLIATLVDVHAAYPELPVPITVTPPAPHAPRDAETPVARAGAPAGTRGGA